MEHEPEISQSTTSGGTATTFRAAVAPGGAADAVTHYKAYDDALDVNEALSSESFTLAAGADAIFPEALTDEGMFREFVRRIDAPLLANMTEFGRTPYFTADQFRDMGYRMVIWPVSSLRVSAKASEGLYATIRDAGSAESLLPKMQTRAELYDLIGYHDFEALDQSIAKSVIP